MMTSEIETSQLGRASWQDADRTLRRLAARRSALDAEEARWLLIARRERVHEHHGFGSFVEYCERILGYVRSPPGEPSGRPSRDASAPRTSARPRTPEPVI